MKIDEQRSGNIVILSIDGRLDHEGSDIFDAHVSRLVARGEKFIVVDFHGVDFVASMGIRALIKPYQALAQQGGRVVVARLSDTIGEVFRISGISQAIPAYDTVEDAVASF